MELSALGELGPSPVFDMLEAPYDDFQVKMHVRKIQGMSINFLKK